MFTRLTPFLEVSLPLAEPPRRTQLFFKLVTYDEGCLWLFVETFRFSLALPMGGEPLPFGPALERPDVNLRYGVRCVACT